VVGLSRRSTRDGPYHRNRLELRLGSLAEYDPSLGMGKGNLKGRLFVHWSCSALPSKPGYSISTRPDLLSLDTTGFGLGTNIDGNENGNDDSARW
jgi:hypothetical protein